MKRTIMAAGVGLALLAGTAAIGEEGAAGRGDGGRPMGPPPEAFAACEGKTAGAAAQFTNPAGEVVTGKCVIADNRLVLRPDHPKGGGREGRQGPPPEAYAACEGKKAGAVSQFTDPRGEVLKGICEEESGRMVLRPDRNRGERPGLATGGTGTGRGR